MHAFYQAVDSVKLLDLRFTGPSFIWSNGRLGKSGSWNDLIGFCQFCIGIDFFDRRSFAWHLFAFRPFALICCMESQTSWYLCVKYIFRFESLWREERNAGSWCSEYRVG